MAPGVVALLLASTVLGSGLASPARAQPSDPAAIDRPARGGEVEDGRVARRALREQMQRYRDALAAEQRELLERRRRDPASLEASEREALRAIMQRFRDSLSPADRVTFDRERTRRGRRTGPDHGTAAGDGVMQDFRDSLEADELALAERWWAGDRDVSDEDRARLRQRVRDFARSLAPEDRRALREHMRMERRELRRLAPEEHRARREVWGDLTPEERRRVRESWKGLGPERRHDAEGRLRRYRELPDDERSLLRDRYLVLRDADARERRRIEANAERWRAMSPERQRLLRQQMERLRAMPPEQRLDLLERLLEPDMPEH